MATEIPVQRSAERARRSPLGPTVYALAVIGLRVALVAALLAAGYLLFGLFSGQLSGFAGLAKAERARIFANVLLARNVLNISLAVAAFLAAFVFLAEGVTGYLLALFGLLFYAGVPYGFTLWNENQALASNTAVRHALVAFPTAAWSPLAAGVLLIVRDVVLRLVSAVQNKPLRRESLQYGGSAQEETGKRPVRLALLAKCWEGPFCREFIRVHCPIFLARKACWRVKRGCYCEEEIVSQAAGRVSGVQLSMAPDARYNFANAPAPGAHKPQLSPAQKKERCRHCVIYNEHQRQKYGLLLPVVAVGVLGSCFVFAPVLRLYLGLGLQGVDSIMSRFTFGSASQAFSWSLGRPSPTVEWFFLGALALMLLSKALQVLEWAVFKIKI